MAKADVSPGQEVLFVHKGIETTYIPQFNKKRDEGLCLFSPLQFPSGRAHNQQPLPPNLSWGYVPGVAQLCRKPWTYDSICARRSDPVPALPGRAQCSTGASPWPPASLLLLLSGTQTLPLPGGEAHFPHVLFILANK